MLAPTSTRLVIPWGLSTGKNGLWKATRAFGSSLYLANPQKTRKQTFGYPKAGRGRRSETLLGRFLLEKVKEVTRQQEAYMATTHRRLQRAKAAKDHAAGPRLEYKLSGQWKDFQEIAHFSRMTYAAVELYAYLYSTQMPESALQHARDLSSGFPILLRMELESCWHLAFAPSGLVSHGRRIWGVLRPVPLVLLAVPVLPAALLARLLPSWVRWRLRRQQEKKDQNEG